MKKILLSPFYLSILLVVLGGCTTDKQIRTVNEYYKQRSDEELFGTWVNTDYFGVSQNQKYILYAWGYAEAFSDITNQKNSGAGTFFILDRWTDSDGYIWYKHIFRNRNNPNSPFCHLTRIDESKGTMETVWRLNEFISESEWTPNDTNYRIYYRQ